MSLTKKDYTSGTTVITADNLNAIQDAITNIDSNITEINSDISNLSDKITSVHNSCWINSGTVASIFQQTVTPCTVTIPADSNNRIYLALGFVELSASNSNIMSCSFSGTNISVLMTTATRTTALSGGGSVSWMIFENTPGTEAKVSIASYGYNNSTYNIIGKLAVIRLS